MLPSFRVSLLLTAVTLLCSSPLSAAHARVLDAVAIMHQPSSNNICAVTFDDGPTAFTSQLLDSLRAEGVHATFFLLGQQIKRRPDLVRRMVEEGHEVASHGYSHPNMRKLGKDARYFELHETNVLLEELGVEPRFFRPPYGKFDPALADMAQDLGMSTVMWTTDSRDWKRRPDYSNMPNAIGRRLQPEEMRGIFLFHDTRQATVQDIRSIFQHLREGGCQRFVTVGEYFSLVEEPLMTARPDIPERELQDAHANAARNASPARPARNEAVRTEAASPEAAGSEAANSAAALPVAAEHNAAAQENSVQSMPLVRSSVPWFVQRLFRSGS